MIKHATLLLAAFLFVLSASAQKKETVKGSRMVTIEQKQTEPFTALEVRDDLEISLIKGDQNGVEIEADDNLHEVLGIAYNDSIMVLSMSKKISGFKKFSIRVTYTDQFKSVTAKGKSVVNALEEIHLDEIAFQSFDNAQLHLNLAPKSFRIAADGRSRVQLNAKSESGSVIISKNAELKALVSASEFKCDLYQKAEATIEGDVIDFTLRLDNNASFIGKKLSAKNIALTAEGYVVCDVWADTAFSMEASGDAEIRLYGAPKIEIKKFTDSAKLLKKVMN